eukprot:12273308-Prorocentrum_lima.AAC.1
MQRESILWKKPKKLGAREDAGQRPALHVQELGSDRVELEVEGENGEAENLVDLDCELGANG